MNETQRRIDKEQIARLEKDLRDCHAGYAAVCKEVETLKSTIVASYSRIDEQAELMKAHVEQSELLRRQIGMHEGIVVTMAAELKRQEPRILAAQTFLRKLHDLEGDVRAADKR